MSTTPTRALVFTAALTLSLLGAAAAQDSPAQKDDDLDNLLKKLDEKDAQPGPVKPEAKKATEAGGAAEKKGERPDAAKPKGEPPGKDKELDSLLEKLGSSDDKPSPDDRKPQAGGPDRPEPDGPPPPDKPGTKKDRPGALTGKAKEIDEHLEELTGKRRRKNRRDDADSGPLSEVIKEMRDVEKRLGKPDTGEETRRKQTQIVKRLETLIEQAKASGQGRPGRNRPMRPGQQPGGLQDQPGANGGNAPFTKAQKPTDRRSLAGGKVPWGHLPPEMRQEMDNVFKEDPLPSREELIRRYYLSVSQKNLARGR